MDKLLKPGARVIQDGTGYAGSYIEPDDEDPAKGRIRFDWQRPSSEPKTVPVATLTVVSRGPKG